MWTYQDYFITFSVPWGHHLISVLWCVPNQWTPSNICLWCVPNQWTSSNICVVMCDESVETIWYLFVMRDESVDTIWYLFGDVWRISAHPLIYIGDVCRISAHHPISGSWCVTNKCKSSDICLWCVTNQGTPSDICLVMCGESNTQFAITKRRKQMVDPDEQQLARNGGWYPITRTIFRSPLLWQIKHSSVMEFL
jgi:hypothetical protein